MRVLFVGLGNLGSQVFDLFVLRAKNGDEFLVGGRNQHYLRERTHWTAAAAFQLGTPIKIDTAFMDVRDVDQTAQTISAFKPDVIFSSLSLLPSSTISQLLSPLFERLVQAQGDPWLPTTLALLYKLMQAVQQTGLKIIVLNGGTPDTSHEILNKVGLAPTSGIGNIALAIPPLKHAIAEQLHRPLEQVEIRFFTHVYVIQSLRLHTADFHTLLPSLLSDLLIPIIKTTLTPQERIPPLHIATIHWLFSQWPDHFFTFRTAFLKLALSTHQKKCRFPSLPKLLKQTASCPSHERGAPRSVHPPQTPTPLPLNYTSVFPSDKRGCTDTVSPHSTSIILHGLATCHTLISRVAHRLRPCRDHVQTHTHSQHRLAFSHDTRQKKTRRITRSRTLYGELIPTL